MFPSAALRRYIAAVLGSSAQFRRRLLRWFHENRRDLPWRIPISSPAGCPDAYHVLVSELMLQQTQVAIVIPYFQRFIEAFPTISDLATAEESQVLRLWQGLGYYRRARHLHRAAQAVVADYNSRLPCDVESLMKLPGIGRYTAGAIASLAYNLPAPILDGNVARVLCRLEKIEADPTTKPTVQRLWSIAQELTPKQNPGDFNSAMMELGALVCLPQSPRCLACPVQKHCQAFAAQRQDRIPVRKSKLPAPLLRRWTFCVQSGQSWLIEQRPADGRWAGMWQFLTVPAGEYITDQSHQRDLPIAITQPQPIGQFRHILTHRRYEFEVFRCKARSRRLHKSHLPRRWATLQEMDKLPMPRPQLRIAALLQLGTSAN